MNGIRRIAGPLLLASFVALAAIALSGAVPGAGTDAAIPRWTGGIDLYRAGVFTTQKTWPTKPIFEAGTKTMSEARKSSSIGRYVAPMRASTAAE